MPKIRQLNTLKNYNSLFRSMIKNQLEKNHRKRSVSRRNSKANTNHTRQLYEEMIRLKKVRNRMSTRIGSKI